MSACPFYYYSMFWLVVFCVFLLFVCFISMGKSSNIIVLCVLFVCFILLIVILRAIILTAFTFISYRLAFTGRFCFFFLGDGNLLSVLKLLTLLSWFSGDF